MPLPRPLILAALLVATFGASAQQVYKWVDPSGKVRYSDMPQTGWKRVDPATGAAIEPSAAVSVPAPDAAETEGDDEELQADSDVAEASDGEPSPALKAQECKRRKEQLATYQSANRIVEQDAQGKEKVYSETERLKLIETTQRQVKELCG
ncbi:MAG TPA: DUF4124 domain-containing protein [Fontimonas sp.]